MESNILTFYTDGAYSSSKQKGGWAFYCPQYKLKVCHSEYNTTNNRMEMTAALKVLEFINCSQIKSEIIIYSDSKYLIETMNGNYVKKTNLDLWNKFDQFSNNSIKWIHIKGHSGIEENEITDLLANLASQN